MIYRSRSPPNYLNFFNSSNLEVNDVCKSQKIWINGKSIEVSTEIYDNYIKYDRKYRYFTDDLKQERIIVNQEKETVKVIASREDSYDRLTCECEKEFADELECTEEEAIKNLMIEKLLKSLGELNSSELELIDAIYYKGKTEREFSAETGIPQKTINYRKHKILVKLKKLIEN